MLILIFVIMMSTSGFVLRDTYNIFLKDNVDYKVDLIINEDDYEMIDKNQVKELNLDKKLFSKFDEIASIEYNKLLTTNIMSLEDRETKFPIIIKRGIRRKVKSDLHLKTKLNTNKNKVTIKYMESLSTHAITKRTIGKETYLEYNYNDFLNEYYEQADSDVVQDTSATPEYGVMNSLKRILLPRYQYNNYNKSIGLLALKVLLDDYKTQRRPKIDIAYRLWRIIQIWLIVYLFFAIPLWCTRGWCCCCLCCKFFKPRQTIEAAKKYLISNPPGIFKTKTGDVLYDPTEREKETYEEFDHFLKTN